VRHCALTAIMITSAAIGSAQNKKISDYPLRVHIFRRTETTFYHRQVAEAAKGEGRANLFENGQARGMDFQFNCANRLQTSSGFETFTARTLPLSIRQADNRAPDRNRPRRSRSRPRPDRRAKPQSQVPYHYGNKDDVELCILFDSSDPICPADKKFHSIFIFAKSKCHAHSLVFARLLSA